MLSIALNMLRKRQSTKETQSQSFSVLNILSCMWTMPEIYRPIKELRAETVGVMFLWLCGTVCWGRQHLQRTRRKGNCQQKIPATGKSEMSKSTIFRKQASSVLVPLQGQHSAKNLKSSFPFSIPRTRDNFKATTTLPAQDPPQNLDLKSFVEGRIVWILLPWCPLRLRNLFGSLSFLGSWAPRPVAFLVHSMRAVWKGENACWTVWKENETFWRGKKVLDRVSELCFARILFFWCQSSLTACKKCCEVPKATVMAQRDYTDKLITPQSRLQIKITFFQHTNSVVWCLADSMVSPLMSFSFRRPRLNRLSFFLFFSPVLKRTLVDSDLLRSSSRGLLLLVDPHGRSHVDRSCCNISVNVKETKRTQNNSLTNEKDMKYFAKRGFICFSHLAFQVSYVLSEGQRILIDKSDWRQGQHAITTKTLVEGHLRYWLTLRTKGQENTQRKRDQLLSNWVWNVSNVR